MNYGIFKILIARNDVGFECAAVAEFHPMSALESVGMRLIRAPRVRFVFEESGSLLVSYIVLGNSDSLELVVGFGNLFGMHF